MSKEAEEEIEFQDLCEQHVRLQYAMQSAIATYESAGDTKAMTPKVMRVGINTALADHAALAELLIEKGVFTRIEYLRSIVKFMEKEAEDAAERARQATGNPNLTFH